MEIANCCQAVREPVEARQARQRPQPQSEATPWIASSTGRKR